MDMIDVTEVIDDRTGETVLEVALRGRLLLDCSLLNKGSAFSEQERRDFGLVGLLPSHAAQWIDSRAAKIDRRRWQRWSARIVLAGLAEYGSL